jgi:hypothetical protein
MIRLYARFALTFFAPLAVVLLLIRAQPYDDHELRALLMPTDCEMPCFMAIRPGITSGNDALMLLNANEWVKQVEVYPVKLPAAYGSHPGAVWTWNGSQPAWIDASQPGVLTIENGLVSNIRLQSTIHLGEVRLALGEPGSQRTSNTQSPAGVRFLSYDAIYPANRLWISTGALCPVKQPFEPFRQLVFLQWFGSTRMSLNPSSAWADVYQNC